MTIKTKNTYQVDDLVEVRDDGGHWGRARIRFGDDKHGYQVTYTPSNVEGIHYWPLSRIRRVQL